MMKYYNRVLKNIESVTGTTDTTNHTLDKIGRRILLNYRGSFPYDQLPTLEDGESAIINQDKAGEPGSHWMAVFMANNKLYGYDSFGRSINKLVPIGEDIENDTEDKEQADEQTNCGARCLAFIYCVENCGLENALKI